MAAVPIHPVCKLFPEMNAEQMDDLEKDIRENGLREPITTWQGQIIDGRNRLIACQRAGVEPQFREWEGAEEDLVAYVVSLNLHRRHLTESQRAMVASRIATMRKGNPVLGSENANAEISAFAQTEAADMLQVDRRSVQHARQVQEHGVPELVAAVEKGEASVSAAAVVATLPEEEQREAVKSGKKGVAEKAKALKAARKEPLPRLCPEQTFAEEDELVQALVFHCGEAHKAMAALGRFVKKQGLGKPNVTRLVALRQEVQAAIKENFDVYVSER